MFDKGVFKCRKCITAPEEPIDDQATLTRSLIQSSHPRQLEGLSYSNQS